MTAMSIVAHSHPFVVGVDTHARNHVYAILDATNGALLDTQAFPTTAAGINRAIKWVARRTDADADTLWVIEGAASYGAILAGTVATHGFPVAEAPRMDAKKHRGVGKTDALDAHRIALAVLPLPVEKLRRPRLNEGVRQGLRILVTARESMTKDRTRSVNALNALVRGNDLGIDARKKLTGAQITEVSRWRERERRTASAHRPGRGRPAGQARSWSSTSNWRPTRSSSTSWSRSARPRRLLEVKGFGRSPPRSAWRRGRTRAGSVAKPHSPPWPG